MALVVVVLVVGHVEGRQMTRTYRDFGNPFWSDSFCLHLLLVLGLNWSSVASSTLAKLLGNEPAGAGGTVANATEPRREGQKF